MKWLNENSRKFLLSSYITDGSTPEDRIREIADHAEKLLEIEGFGDKFYGYMSKGYYSLSSPVWANFGKKRGLPVSCFGSYVGDSVGEILSTHAEVGMMSKLGGGTSGYLGDLRPRGANIKNNGASSGSVHFMQLFDKIIDVISQGSTRRGQFASYLPIEHKDIDEFLNIGTEGDQIQKILHGVTVSDKWMQEMIDGDEKKRSVWAKVLQRRSEMGYPYILFRDNANNNTVDVYKDKKLEILASNLCTEIMLPSNEEWSFVCVLSSINLLHYEQWKDTDAVETMVYFLDAVVTEFLTRLEEYRDSKDLDDQLTYRFMEKAYAFAKANRAVGLGVLGYHSLLQSKGIPFASRDAARLNLEIFKNIQERSYKASEELAEMFGEPEVLKGYGRRNATLNAVAPTTSSAFILGQVSQSIEPIWSNIYVRDVEKAKVTIKNHLLVDLLKKKKKNTKAVWENIRAHDGSVQQLSFLTAKEKEIFKTYPEINQMDIVYQAAARQKYIDQGQSLNVMIHPDTPIKDVNQMYVNAWKTGVKSLYYQHSMNAAQKFAQKLICEACEA